MYTNQSNILDKTILQQSNELFLWNCCIFPLWIIPVGTSLITELVQIQKSTFFFDFWNFISICFLDFYYTNDIVMTIFA